MPRDVIPTACHQTRLRSMNASDATQKVLSGDFNLSKDGHKFMYKRGYTFPKSYDFSNSETGASRVTTANSTDRGTKQDSNATASNASTIKASRGSTVKADEKR